MLERCECCLPSLRHRPNCNLSPLPERFDVFVLTFLQHNMRELCFAGFHYDLLERNTFGDTPEERRKHFDYLWDERQGFGLWLGGYKVRRCSHEA